MGKVKQALNELLLEFKIKWRELGLLISVCISELFAFSYAAIAMPVVATVTIACILVTCIISFAILAIRNKGPTKKDLKIFGIFVLISLLLGVTRSYLYIMSLIIAYLFYEDRKKMYKWMFLISSVSFMGFLMLVFVRLIPDFPLIRNTEELIILRHTFGFVHPNQPMKYYLICVLTGYLWLCDNHKKTFIFTLACLPMYALISYNTYCRTGAILLAISFILMNLPSCLIKWIKTNWLYLGFLLVTAFLTLSYSLGFDSLNSVLSGRPYFFDMYVTRWPSYMIFGKCYDPMLINLKKYPLDNTYLYTLFDGGIFAIITITYLFFKAFNDNKDHKITVVLISILTYALTEALVIVFVDILFVLIFVNLLEKYHHKDKVIVKEE